MAEVAKPLTYELSARSIFRRLDALGAAQASPSLGIGLVTAVVPGAGAAGTDLVTVLTGGREVTAGYVSTYSPAGGDDVVLLAQPAGRLILLALVGRVLTSGTGYGLGPYGAGPYG